MDGDQRYSEKTIRQYKKIGLEAVVKNIPESKQPHVVIALLQKYNPDILVLTGHDAMIRKDRDFYDIQNYRNSKFFVKAVINARKWCSSSERLFIFAGACQSFYEAIMDAGADFASSPGRILIDFIDPIIIAKKIATTEKDIYISAEEIHSLIKEGKRGISGIGVKGKKQHVIFLKQ